MNQSLIMLALQEPVSDNSMLYVIIGIILFLFFVVVVIAIGLIVFFVMRKRKKAQAASAALPAEYSSGMPAVSSPEEPAYAVPEVSAALDAPPPAFEAPPMEEIRADVAEASIPAPPAAESDSGPLDFDPSRTVAINREPTVAISYGTIKFVSGALSGQEFNVNPEGSYIGRESSLSQIVVPDPRISKRHLWIGVKDGLVKIVDNDSRNGTFVNDPRSERITEATLNTGDVVILGESDVARFEYQM